MAPTTSTSERSPASIGARLERERLEFRARRLERVVDALRTRAHDHASRGGRVPGGLAASLADFQQELRAVRQRLR